MILLDTNAIVYYLHRVEPYASRVKRILASREDLALTLRIVDEVIFTLIRLEALRKLEIRRLDQLRDYIRKHGLEEFDDAINDADEMINSLGILVLEDKGSLRELLEVMRKYSLLPGDALIAVTAKHYGIDTILTFDEDFKRVPWLKVIP
ncbi:twitching motility protein PilT [Ignicoccus islandicus DSM 13165]|uniref:Ribonuclease VapC n=1 Tax=Ignicoccus islandicus DSM 13165 TaxID=940295 RepID=A0A0U2M9X8_9CREN|nr:PIN domain-containing protein [Ignicoccus islandicus]ALU11901.1 twitching motility protein PilT [Ignicoccus islandicus DSM 13165]